MSKLSLATDLKLPVETVTQTIAILAKRRAGKSYTMRRLAEQLIHANQQLVLVDPKGDQWGIRSAADGKGPGLSIIILGGERGDVPLEPSSGEIVAKLVVEERVSVLLDLSLFRKHEVATFMTHFLENLYRLKAREVYRTPMMLVIDEADAIAPQKPQKGEERMLGAAEDIVRRGGQRGIGCVLVTQRSAVLNKNVLTQAQMLVALRTIAPQDLAAMDAWIHVHGEPEQRKTLMESLPSLPVGDAWFWSPGWPTAEGIFKRVHVLPIETFDSGATPKPGVKPIEPKHAAEVDLEALKRQMAATIEKKKAEDPKELQKTIRELRARVEKLQSRPVEVPVPEIKKVPIILDKDLHRLQELVREYWSKGDEVTKAVGKLTDRLNEIGQTPQRHDVPRRIPPMRTHAAPPKIATVLRHIDQEKGVGTGGLRRMLIALAQRNGLSARQLGVRAGLSSTSGTFGTYLAKARTQGWMTGDSGRLTITDEGLAALGDYTPLPQGQDLLRYWLGQLGHSGAGRMLEVLASAYPNYLTHEELGEKAGMSHKSGTFGTYLSKLRTLELIEGRQELRASEEFFT